ncbi:MAG: phosphatidylinositol-specific phospholipase C/glycerophosphodiester phosphodiesterase family protein [Ginsengibacter sp.]
MKKLLILSLLLSGLNLLGQPSYYTTANVHSHNDYEQKTPFWLAYNENFGSMEADIFLQNGELLVGHEKKDLVSHRTLEEYYLRNLQHCIEKNDNHPYADTSRKLQLLIDIKTDSIATLDKLVEILKKYPTLINSPSVTFVITGNRPAASRFAGYPSFIYFDGVLSQSYSQEAFKKIVLMSDDFKTYSQWNGKGIVPAKEWTVLKSAVDKAHSLKKPVRFWNAPDFINAWYQFMHLGVDYINTDHIAEISAFLDKLPKTSYSSGSN